MVKKVFKFLCCITIAVVLSGCYVSKSDKTNVPQNDITVDIQDPRLVKIPNNGVIQVSTSSKDEFTFSDKPITEKKWMRVYILKDEQYGNEYVVVYTGDGVGVCPRQRY